MQKRATALNPGLLAGIIISVLLHLGMLGVDAFRTPTVVELDSGTIAVELTLIPSIASAPAEAPVAPEPIAEPQMTLPVPPQEQPADFQPLEAPEPPPEPQEQSQPNIESIDQSGSLEEDKGALSEAVAETSIRIIYPALSRRRGEEGMVTLSFDILINGAVSNIQITQSSGCKRLDKAAVQAIEKARFKPATRLGKPVQTTETKTFNFRLTDD